MAKSFLVIGMGRFGVHLARKLSDLGNDVMIVDTDDKLIARLSGEFTDAKIGDCTDESTVKSLGVGDFDICFVAVGENFQSSLEVTSLLREHGAKYIVCKAQRDIQSKFLRMCGADEVVCPERDMAEKTAIRHNARNIFDYIELTKEYAIYEVPAPERWIGRKIGELCVRSKYRINILAVKNGEELMPLPDADYTFVDGDRLLALGRSSDITRLGSKA